MYTQLLKCDKLRACDEYFVAQLSGSFLGDLEPRKGEVEHLAVIVARELKEKQTDIKGSLSVAVFLTWMGSFYYEEGNYWGPVYRKLGLPKEQVKWQGILGGIFLRAVEEYKLHKLEGEMRYIIPILAHGYIPNWYLDVYFAAVLLPLYTQREEIGLRLQWEDTEHTVLSWRREYSEYGKYRIKVEELENGERDLRNLYTTRKYRDSLLRLQNLQRDFLGGDTIGELLSFPENWLEKEEQKRLEAKMHYDFLKSCEREYRRVEGELKSTERELQELNERLEKAASEILTLWEGDFAGLLLHIPAEKVSLLARECRAPRGVLSRILNYLSRFFAPFHHKRRQGIRKQLVELLSPLPMKQHLLFDPWPTLPHKLVQMQDLIKQLEDTTLQWEEIDASRREIAVSSGEDMAKLLVELDEITHGIGAYKTKLVELGKGNMEEGMDILAEQRGLRLEVELLQAECPPDAAKLFPHLAEVNKYPHEDSLQKLLEKVKKEKERVAAKGKMFSNPLYQLNESTRAFIFQGGKKAVQFIYESLLLIDAVCKGQPLVDILLPARIKTHMVDWWKREGKALYAAAWQGKERGLRGGTSAIIRRPVLKFDPEAEEIRVFLPSQPVTEKAKAKFYVKDDVGKKQVADLPLYIDRETGILRSEELILPLKHPQQNYIFFFVAGEDTRTWQQNGLGRDNLYLFFDKKGNLIEDGELAPDGIYLIAPRGTSTDPMGQMREQLKGYWSGYEYRYIDLENTDVLMARTGGALSIYKYTEQLAPQLLSGDVLAGVNTGGFPVYQGRLPDLLFSLDHPEEMQFYGMTIESQGKMLFRSLEDLIPVHSGDNIICLSLADLVEKKYGLHKITLLKGSQVIWSTQCGVVPDLRLEFDQLAYIVRDNSDGKGRLEFSSRFKCAFVPSAEDNRSVKRLSPSSIEFNTGLEVIAGRLTYFLATSFSLDINIFPPVIRWRPRGGTWRGVVGEIWHDDLGEIEVKIPAALGRRISLTLQDEKQIIKSHVHHKIATFDLKRFSDTLQASAAPLQEIIFSCPGEKSFTFVLLRVRTRWQVSNIQIDQQLKDGNLYLNIKWEDLGRVGERMFRLWPLHILGGDYVEKAVPAGVSTLNLVVPETQILPGRYRLEWAQYDPWDSTAVQLPEAAGENCLDIDIGKTDEILLTHLGKRLVVTALGHGKQKIKVEGNYWLRVDDFNPTFEGEPRLIGNIYLTDPDGVTRSMPYNPVSFYLNGSQMPFLIDRDGDGATYCRRCRVLFWEVAHCECGDAVILPDIIFVKGGDG